MIDSFLGSGVEVGFPRRTEGDVRGEERVENVHSSHKKRLSRL